MLNTHQSGGKQPDVKLSCVHRAELRLDMVHSVELVNEGKHDRISKRGSTLAWPTWIRAAVRPHSFAILFHTSAGSGTYQRLNPRESISMFAIMGSQETNGGQVSYMHARMHAHMHARTQTIHTQVNSVNTFAEVNN